MRVFVTGGTGFVGAHVVRAHLSRGDEVRCLVRESSPGATLEGLEVERVQAPLTDPEALARAVRGCDAIQHVAGIFDPGPSGNKKMHEVHVQGTKNLLRAAEQEQVGAFVLCSSSITVGWGSLEDPADEQSELPDPDIVYGTGTALRAYYDTKLESERLTREAADQGLRAMIVNPDYVIGSWDIKPTSGAIILTMARRGWIPVFPQGGKCFIDARACGLGHVLALERGQAGRRYLLGTQNLSYRDFMTLAAEVVSAHRPILPIPRLATKGLGLVGAVLARVDPHRAAGLDRRVLATMQAQRYRTGARARDELGLPQTPIKESIEDAYTWFVEHGYL